MVTILTWGVPDEEERELAETWSQSPRAERSREPLAGGPDPGASSGGAPSSLCDGEKVGVLPVEGRSHQAAQAVRGRTDTWPPRADTDTPSSLPPARDLQCLLEHSPLCYRVLAPGRSLCLIPLSAAIPYPFPTHLALGGSQHSSWHPGSVMRVLTLETSQDCLISVTLPAVA